MSTTEIIAAPRRRWWHCTCPHMGEKIAAFPDNMFHIMTCRSTASGKEFERTEADGWVLEYPADDAALPDYDELRSIAERNAQAAQDAEKFEVTFGELDDLGEEDIDTDEDFGDDD